MYNKEVIYTHFPFYLIYLQNKASNASITQHRGDLCNYYWSRKAIITIYSESGRWNS